MYFCFVNSGIFKLFWKDLKLFQAAFTAFAKLIKEKA
jgi:hypothetical protein